MGLFPAWLQEFVVGTVPSLSKGDGSCVIKTVISLATANCGGVVGTALHFKTI